MTIEEAAKEFVEKHKPDSIDVDYINRQFGSVKNLLEQEGQYDNSLLGGNTYIEINGFDSKSGNPEIIDWYQTEWQVSYYDLPQSERTDQRDWTIKESFDNNFDEVISYIKQLRLDKKTGIRLCRWENGNPVEEEDWKFYIDS
jgi:hypothetical protein